MMFNIARALMPLKKDTIIRNRLRHTKNIVYGARALNAQLAAPFQRHTEDYDVYSNAPHRHARMMEGELDKNSGGDFYYTKPALHPGTFKVMDKGMDRRKGTDDDFGIVDYTKPTRSIKSVTIRGIRYAKLSERKKDALKSLGNPEFQFRHEKDRKDLWRIKQGNKLRRFLGW